MKWISFERWQEGCVVPQAWVSLGLKTLSGAGKVSGVYLLVQWPLPVRERYDYCTDTTCERGAIAGCGVVLERVPRLFDADRAKWSLRFPRGLALL